MRLEKLGFVVDPEDGLGGCWHSANLTAVRTRTAEDRLPPPSPAPYVCAMLGPPPYTLAAPAFAFRSLAALVGRAALGGPRETALATLIAARLAAGAAHPVALALPLRAARADAARIWLTSVALPAPVRAAIAQTRGRKRRQRRQGDPHRDQQGDRRHRTAADARCTFRSRPLGGAVPRLTAPGQEPHRPRRHLGLPPRERTPYHSWFHQLPLPR